MQVEVYEGKNSVRILRNTQSIFYEKLSNSIHVGDSKDITNLQKRVEEVDYNPEFESESLRRGGSNKCESLVLEVTEECNLRCIYCIYSGQYEGEREHGNKRMSFETARKAMDIYFSRAEPVAMISFYGGEPTLNMELIREAIKYAKLEYPEQKVIYSMTSNFVDVEDIIPELAREDFGIIVSLDGPQEVHDKYRKRKGGGPTWEEVMKNVELFRRSRNPSSIRHIATSVTCIDKGLVGKVIEFFRDRNGNIPLSRIGFQEPKGLKRNLNAPSQKEDYSEEYVQTLIRGGTPEAVLCSIFDQGLQLISKRSDRRMPTTVPLKGCCYPGAKKLYVSVEGNIHMCEKFGNRVPIGYVSRGIDVGKIDDVIEDFRKIRGNVCREGCWAQRLCAPCIQTAKDPSKEISEEGLLSHCSSSKRELINMIVIYARLSQKNPERLREHLEQIAYV